MPRMTIATTNARIDSIETLVREIHTMLVAPAPAPEPVKALVALPEQAPAPAAKEYAVLHSTLNRFAGKGRVTGHTITNLPPQGAEVVRQGWVVRVISYDDKTCGDGVVRPGVRYQKVRRA